MGERAFVGPVGCNAAAPAETVTHACSNVGDAGIEQHITRVMETEDVVLIGSGQGESRVLTEERALLERLLRRDVGAFSQLVDRHHGLMVRLAQTMVPSRAVAEEVAQETWQVVVQRLPAFEARSSLKTWIFKILVKRARTRGVREHRSVPYSAFSEGEERSQPPYRTDESQRRVQAPILRTERTPENALLDSELRTAIQAAIDALPEAHRALLTLRDVAGWSSEEACNVLDITETNQRVMLHRARSKVREALLPYLDPQPAKRKGARTA